MDNRTEKRIPKAMNAILHEKGNSLIDGRVRDISSNGIYIELGMEQRMKQGSSVRVAFKTPLGLHIVPSLVVRADSDGSAMVFTRKDDRLDAALARMAGDETAAVRM